MQDHGPVGLDLAGTGVVEVVDVDPLTIHPVLGVGLGEGRRPAEAVQRAVVEVGHLPLTLALRLEQRLVCCIFGAVHSLSSWQ